MSNTYQKKHLCAQSDPQLAEVAVPEQVIVSMAEIAGVESSAAGEVAPSHQRAWRPVGPVVPVPGRYRPGFTEGLGGGNPGQR